VVSSTPRPHFTPGKDPVPIVQEAEWAPGPVWTGGKSRPHRDSIPDRPARSSVAIPTELPGPNFITCRTFISPSLFIILLHFWNVLSNLSSRSFSNIKFESLKATCKSWVCVRPANLTTVHSTPFCRRYLF